jgi:lambda family phage portal protein
MRKTGSIHEARSAAPRSLAGISPARSLLQRFGAWLAGTPGRAEPASSIQPNGRAPSGRALQRMYQGARGTATSGGYGMSGSSSADAELSTSAARLRARSRQMLRDSPYAKCARAIVVNNVIGSGIGVQAQVMTTRKEVSARVNAGIEREFAAWCAADSCHTGGAMHFCDLERALRGEVFAAGEVFIRLHPLKLGRSKVPLALELIEAERVPDGIDTNLTAAQPSASNEVRMGVEVDRFGRPVAYWIRRRHPGDLRNASPFANEELERVPADQIIHLRRVTRWPQTRGEPELHTVLNRLNDMNEYSALEVQAARASAALFATIKTPEEQSPLPDDTEGETEKPVVNIDPLTVQELAPGEELTLHNPQRPNTALDPFMRYMLREIASGVGVSYASLSRDYSQSNYSSSRLALLDDRDTWKAEQQWWLRSFRERLHQVWLERAVLARAIPEIAIDEYALDRAKFEAVKFKLRGWSWVDPTKEVEAYKEARRAGFISTSDIVDQTAGGRDVEDVIADIEREDALFAAAGIRRDTEVPNPDKVAGAPVPDKAAVDEPAEPNEDDDAPQPSQEGGRVVALSTARH